MGVFLGWIMGISVYILLLFTPVLNVFVGMGNLALYKKSPTPIFTIILGITGIIVFNLQVFYLLTN